MFIKALAIIIVFFIILGIPMISVTFLIEGHEIIALLGLAIWVLINFSLLRASNKVYKGGGVDSPIVTLEHVRIVKTGPDGKQEIRESRTR